MLQSSGTILLRDFLPELLKGVEEERPVPQPEEEPGMEKFVIRQRLTSEVRDLYAKTHRQLDRLLLPRVLEHTSGSLQEAALQLGIARQTLRMKLRDLGLSVPRFASGAGREDG